MESKKDPFHFYAFIRHGERADQVPEDENRLID